MSESFYHRKTIEELTFTDDGMFQAVLHEPEICAELIERLLHLSVKNVEYPELEKQIAPYYTTKGVRLDVYLKDDDKPFGLPCYTFRNICEEKSDVKLNDKSVKVIYNSSAYEKEEDERIRNLLKFISTNEPGKDDFSNRLSSIVEQLKENEKFRSDYAAMNLHDRDIQRAARREENLKKAIEDAVIAVQEFKVSPQLAAEKMNAPLDKVLEKLKVGDK